MSMMFMVNVDDVHGKCQRCSRKMSMLLMVNVDVVRGKCQYCSWQISMFMLNVDVVYVKRQGSLW
jgi:DNA-directed RNA polymerase subunit RPC12/RpoP